MTESLYITLPVLAVLFLLLFGLPRYLHYSMRKRVRKEARDYHRQNEE